MEKHELRKDENLFTISLDGIKLDDDQKHQINKAIKSAVMVELARLDNSKDLIINHNLDLYPWPIGPRPPFPWGIWIESFDRYRERLRNITQLDPRSVQK